MSWIVSLIHTTLQFDIDSLALETISNRRRANDGLRGSFGSAATIKVGHFIKLNIDDGG